MLFVGTSGKAKLSLKESAAMQLMATISEYAAGGLLSGSVSTVQLLACCTNVMP